MKTVFKSIGLSMLSIFAALLICLPLNHLYKTLEPTGKIIEIIIVFVIMCVILYCGFRQINKE